MPVPRRPDPAPLETDDVAFVTAGTVVWAVALVATIVWRDALADRGHDSWAWVCLAGVFLGLLGVRKVRRRRAERRHAVPKQPVR